ncbi:MAG: hypothetical protein GXP23_09530 [Gammaproteobacteria bacterium]|nr:hypothetical protein [Gammaproteobacteria bacterium]
MGYGDLAIHQGISDLFILAPVTKASAARVNFWGTTRTSHDNCLRDRIASWGMACACRAPIRDRQATFLI